MADIVFEGIEDFRILGPEDLEKAGVTGFEEFTFARGVVVPVTDEVAAALLNNPDLFGKFSGVESNPDELFDSSIYDSEEAKLADMEAEADKQAALARAEIAQTEKASKSRASKADQ